MSGIKDNNLADAYRILHARGITTGTLAVELITARSYVSRVLSGYERRGKAWLRLRLILAERAPEALALLEAMDVSGKPVQQTTARTAHRRSAPIIPFTGIPKNHQAAPTTRRFTQWRQAQHA